MLRLLLLALTALGLIVFVRWLLGGRPAVKCATCVHCRRLFHDGVMCGFRDKEVFKNPAQIDMCPDYEPRHRAG